MNFILMLLVVIMASCATDGNPDNGNAGQPSGDAGNSGDTGSLASLDDAATSDTEDDAARSDTTGNGGEGGNKPPVTEPELILGKFKTPDDLVTAYQELERKLTEVTTKTPAATQPEPDANAWVELSPEQMATLQETDPDAHKWYLEEQANRKIQGIVDKATKPLLEKLAPIDELQKKELANQFFAHEDNMLAETKRSFGNEFPALDKQRQDVSFLQKVFKEMPKPLANTILEQNKNGSPEYARQLLLGQIQVYNLRQNSHKRSMSVNPDAGSSPGKMRTSDSAATLEEAGDLAAQELGIK